MKPFKMGSKCSKEDDKEDERVMYNKDDSEQTSSDAGNQSKESNSANQSSVRSNNSKHLKVHIPTKNESSTSERPPQRYTSSPSTANPRLEATLPPSPRQEAMLPPSPRPEEMLPPPRPPKPQSAAVRRVLAIHDFEARDEEEIDFKAGDILEIISVDEIDWAKARHEVTGQKGGK